MAAPGPLYELHDAEASGPLGVVFKGVALVIPDRAVTALMGPVGSGKSTMLRALSGRDLPEGWQLGGGWRYRGQDLRPIWRRQTPLADTAWVPQIRHAPAGEFSNPAELAASLARLDSAFLCGARTLLLDEPTRGLDASHRDALEQRLRAHTERGAAVVITHNLGFARRIADEVGLLCEGELVTQAPAPRFFERPESELAAQFVRSGTCAQPAPTPLLPRHFHWSVPGVLAGMGRPGLLRALDDDLLAIAHAGVSTLVSLTEDPIPTARLRPFGIGGRHFPVADMGVPPLADTVALCRRLDRTLQAGHVVAVHCRAGLGRTGTILACMAVVRGQSPDVAIDEVRRNAPGSLQTDGQERFVHRFAEQW